MTKKSKAKHRMLIRHFKLSLQDEQKRLQEIKKFEHQHYLRHHQLPSPSDTEYTMLIKSHRFIQKIIVFRICIGLIDNSTQTVL